MSNARNLANLLGTNTTIQTAKLADSAVTTAKLNSTIDLSGKTLTLPSGSVVNTVHASSGITYNHNSSSEAATGITASITPKSSSNKIIVQAVGMMGAAFDTNFGRGRFKRKIGSGSYADVGNEFFTGGNFAHTYGNRTTEEWSFHFEDSPSTTSAVTYQLYVRVLDGDDMWWGRWGQDANWTQPTTITLFEIAG